MSLIFADTSFFIAWVRKADQHHLVANQLYDALLADQIVSSEEVLTELLSYAAQRPSIRSEAIDIVYHVLQSKQFLIVPSESKRFHDALDMMQSRADKGYSLVDCSSMLLMIEAGISDVLTGDKHFAQEGFNKLF